MIHSCRSRADFDRLRKEGVRKSSDKLWIRYVTDTQCTPPRVAFALGRRNGNAPTRNRLRRQLRAIMSHGDVVVPPGLFLIGHNGNIESCSVSSLRLEVGSLLNRIGARK